MEIFNQIGNLSSTELHDLQDTLLAEIQRRNVIPGAFPAKKSARRKSAPTNEAEPVTLPLPNRRLRPLSPRRRAA
jgi:hypothetical protein